MFLCTFDMVSLFNVCSRSMCLDLVQTSMETGTTTGRTILCPVPSDTQESMTEITNTMSPCCWQTNTKSKCLRADDTGRPTSKLPLSVHFPFLHWSSLSLSVLLTNQLSFCLRQSTNSANLTYMLGCENTEHHLLKLYYYYILGVYFTLFFL